MGNEQDKGVSASPPGCQPASDPDGSSRSGIPNAFNVLREAIIADPDYAWGWHCNIAMPVMDAANVSHRLANEAAAYVMHTLFDYDITTHPHYQYGKSIAQEYTELRIAAEREEDASGIVAATAGETACGLDERSEQSPAPEGGDAQ